MVLAEFRHFPGNIHLFKVKIEIPEKDAKYFQS